MFRDYLLTYILYTNKKCMKNYLGFNILRYFPVIINRNIIVSQMINFRQTYPDKSFAVINQDVSSPKYLSIEILHLISENFFMVFFTSTFAKNSLCDNIIYNL